MIFFMLCYDGPPATALRIFFPRERQVMLLRWDLCVHTATKEPICPVFTWVTVCEDTGEKLLSHAIMTNHFMEEISVDCCGFQGFSDRYWNCYRSFICGAAKHFHSIWNMCNTIIEMFLIWAYFFVLKFAEIVSDMLTGFFNSFVYLSS